MTRVNRPTLFLAVSFFALAKAMPPTNTTAAFLIAQAEQRGMVHGEKLVALYGNTLLASQNGESPAALAQRFVDEHADALGVDGCDLQLVENHLIKNGAIQVFTYRQTMGIPAMAVYGSMVRIPVVIGVPHRIGFVSARLAQPPSGGVVAGVLTEIQAKAVVEADSRYDDIDPATFTGGEELIFETIDGGSRRAWSFFGTAATTNEDWRFFVDSISAEILEAFPVTLHGTASGTVTGWATPCCAADDDDDPASCPQQVPLSNVKVVSSTGQVAVTEADGEYTFVSLTNGTPIELTATLTNDWVNVINGVGSELETDPPSYVIILNDQQIQDNLNFTFNESAESCATPRPLFDTSQVNAYHAINKTHDWIKSLTQTSLFDLQIDVIVNSGEDLGAYDPNQLAIGLSGPCASICNSYAFSTYASHEYGHFIIDRLGAQITSPSTEAFHEGGADTIAALVWDTHEWGLDARGNNQPVRNLSTPDVQLSGASLPLTCFDRNDGHCLGLALAGAFWDLRQTIGLAATERLFADFLFITDFDLDNSVIAEVLAADDTDGNLCNDSPNKNAILYAFQELHGWAWDNDTFCQPDDSIRVKWVGPIGPPDPSPEVDDYEVINWLDPPHVILKRTIKDTIPVDEWTIGRADASGPLPISRISAEWDGQISSDIRVRIGDPSDADYAVGDVHLIDIPAQSSNHWSNLLFSMPDGAVVGRAQCFASSNGLGGRVSGEIGKTTGRIFAHAVGIGSNDDVDTLLTLPSGIRRIDIETLPRRSTLNVQSGVPGGAEIRIAGDLVGHVTGPAPLKMVIGGDLIGSVDLWSGPLHVNGAIIGDVNMQGGSFSIYSDADGLNGGSILGNVVVQGGLGDICGENIDPSQPLPPNIDVDDLIWVCGVGANTASCSGDVVTAAQAEPSPTRKSRYISVDPGGCQTTGEPPESCDYAIRVGMTKLNHQGHCSVTLGTSCSVDAQCPAGETCVAAFCPPDYTIPCSALSDCPGGATCKKPGRCTQNCAVDADCPPGTGPCAFDGTCLNRASCILDTDCPVETRPCVHPTYQDFSEFEGEHRYVNSVPGAVSRCCNPQSNPLSCNTTHSCNSDADCGGLGANTECREQLCQDSRTLGTYFHCGRLGCSEENRNWGDETRGGVLHVTGSEIVPGSVYHVQLIGEACAENWANYSTAVVVETNEWANVDDQGNVASALDLAWICDKVKDIPGARIKPRTHLRDRILDPASVVNASDIARSVDAVKGHAYPFQICPCSSEVLCAVETPCTAQADCAPEQTCSGGYCRDCTSWVDCGTGQTCVNGYCRDSCGRCELPTP